MNSSAVAASLGLWTKMQFEGLGFQCVCDFDRYCAASHRVSTLNGNSRLMYWQTFLGAMSSHYNEMQSRYEMINKSTGLRD